MGAWRSRGKTDSIWASNGTLQEVDKGKEMNLQARLFLLVAKYIVIS